TLLGRVQRPTAGAVCGRGAEGMGGGRYRVAERGASNRESSAGVAATEAIIAGLFGIKADIPSIEAPLGVTANRLGPLRGVRAVGFDLPVASYDWRDAVRSSLTGNGHVRTERISR